MSTFEGVDLSSSKDRTVIRCACGYMVELQDIDIPGMHSCTFISAKRFDREIARLKAKKRRERNV